MKTQRCKGCGAPVLYATVRGPDGELLRKPDGLPRVVILDTKAPVYRIVDASEGGSRIVVARVDKELIGGEIVTGSFVSHFSTCPKASDFSGSKSSSKPEEPAK